MVNDHGPCFLNGRPFLFQKWNWDFQPTKEIIKDIPLWIKFPNFFLCCWNEGGISKVASSIGVPLTIDSLIAAKAYISFARVCVHISPNSSLPDSIPINLNEIKFEFEQPVVYDWKLKSCSKCNMFSHKDQTCLLNPNKPPLNRGRDHSRPPKQLPLQPLTTHFYF